MPFRNRLASVDIEQAHVRHRVPACSPDRKRAMVHLLFYANRGPDAASVRVSGKYRAARISTADAPAPRSVEMVFQREAVEVHLPQVSQYVALELEV